MNNSSVLRLPSISSTGNLKGWYRVSAEFPLKLYGVVNFSVSPAWNDWCFEEAYQIFRSEDISWEQESEFWYNYLWKLADEVSGIKIIWEK